MTRKELAELLKVDVTTLRNWEKNKPELIRLINLGLQFEKQIDQMEENLNMLKELKEKTKESKIIL